MVAFNAIPGNLKVPFFYTEINSGGSPFEGEPRLLLIGQKLSGGTAPANVPVLVQSEQEADSFAGAGSMLAAMFRVARKNAPFQPIWFLPLADPSGDAAVGTVTITAPGVTGVAIIHVAGTRIAFQVNAADNATTVAAAMVAAINAAKIPVVASNSSAVVTLTARHVGALGNILDTWVSNVEPNVLTSANAEVVAIGAGTAGTGTPALATALANLGDDPFDFIALPYADSTSLNSVRDFLDATSGRWSPVKQLYGHAFTANFGSLGTNVTLGNGRNDPHVSIMASQASPSPVWEWATAFAAQAVAHLGDAPELSRPLQTLPLAGIQPPRDRSKWWSIADRQALYSDGLAGYTVSVDGIVRIDRARTTYQQTAAGAADETFGDVETMAQITFFTRYLKTAVLNRHARQALADENPRGLQEISTPRDIRNTLIHAYNDLVALGVSENPSLFAEFVVVERDPNNASRVNAFVPVDVVNQLRIVAANVTAFLQYQTPSGEPAVA